MFTADERHEGRRAVGLAGYARPHHWSATMNGHVEETRDYRFLTGLAMGGIVGAGLALWLVPKAAAEIRSHTKD
jgi:hypothetical protein